MSADRLTDRVRDQLKYGPVAADALAKRLDEPKRRVASALSRLASRRGSGVLIHDRSPTLYVDASWLDTRRRRKGEAPRVRVNVAGPITIPQFRWGSTRLA